MREQGAKILRAWSQGAMLVTLDLFTGIAGITQALQGLVAPAYYCDINAHSNKVLERLMSRGHIPKAPIWTDVRTLGKAQLAGKAIDMIISSWPCVGFSNMGKRQHFQEAGSSLFYETMRLLDLTKAKAVFFENVPQVLQELQEVREQLVVKRKFQLRWCIIPAYAVGARHSRDRWFCLATRPGFKLEATGLSFKRIDWANEPPRTVDPKQVPQSEVNARCFALGNAVVPECVRKAFFYLASGGRQQDQLASSLTFHATPLVRPLTAAGPALVRYGFVDSSNVLYHMEPMALPAKPDLKLVFDSKLVQAPSQVSYDQRHPMLERPASAALWATPRAGMTQAGRILTERALRDLPSQVRFERGTRNRLWPISPQWVEWLMGYPPGWTA